MPVQEGGGTLVLPDGSYAQQFVVAPQELTLLASAARTTQQTTADQINPGYRGVLVLLNVTVASGAGGLAVRIQYKDFLGGAYSSLNAAPTSVIATGLTSYAVYPTAIAAAITQGTNTVALPRTWRVLVAVGDASSYTYSLSACLLG